MSEFADSLKDKVDNTRDKIKDIEIKRSRGLPVWESVLPEVGKGFTTPEPSEEELVGSGRAKDVPADISWEQARRIARGEEEGPYSTNVVQKLRALVTGEKLRPDDPITFGTYAKQFVAPIATLGERIKRAVEPDQTFIDESGRVYTKSGRPVVTDEDVANLGLEIAGYGLGAKQLIQGVPGAVARARRITGFLREKYGRAPTPVEVSEFESKLNAWNESQRVAAATEAAKNADPIVGPLNRAQSLRQAEENALAELRARNAADPVPPGPRSMLPRPPEGPSQAYPPRQLPEPATVPGRVIEAPPTRRQLLTSEGMIRKKLRDIQAEVTGEYDPTGPHARVVTEPPLRTVETGPHGETVLGKQEPYVETTPREPGAATLRERIGRAEGVNEPAGESGRGPSTSERLVEQGWERAKGETDWTLYDEKGKTQAKIVPVEIDKPRRPGFTKGFAKDIVYELQDANGKVLSVHGSAREAAADAAARFPGRPVEPSKPPTISVTKTAEAPPTRPPEPPTGGPPPSEPSSPTPSLAPAATMSETESAAQAADLRKTFGQGDAVDHGHGAMAPPPSEPYTILGRVWDNYKRAHAHDVKAWRRRSAAIKSLVGFSSPDDISKSDPILRRLYNMTYDASRKISKTADDFADMHHELRKVVDDKELGRLLRSLDEGQPLTGTTPEIAQQVSAFHDAVRNLAAEPTGSNLFKDSYVKRLKHSHELVNGVMVEVPEYTSKDVARVLPGDRGKSLKTRLGTQLKGDEPYTPENIQRMLRATARQSVIGSPLRPGYMKNVKELLTVLKGAPDVIKAEASDMVNHFIGTPGSRSPQSLQRWADRIRAYEVGSKMAYNITSPVWNAFQPSLTWAEVSNKSFFKAWADVIQDWNARVAGGKPDPKFNALIERAGLTHELRAPSIMSDVGQIPSDIMNKFDKAQAKFNNVGMSGFKFIEHKNRLHAFVSGYYDAIDNGLDDAAAIEHGKNIMRKTQFTGGEVDLPYWFRRAPGAVGGQFKTFMIKYAEYMKDNVADAAKAFVDPEMSWKERKHNLNKFVKFWSSQTALGGAAAIPGAGYIFKDQFKELPEVVQKGLGSLIGIDLTRQGGAGVLPGKLRDFLYNVPGAFLTGLQDAWAVTTFKNKGSGGDFTGFDDDLTYDQWERKLVRLLPAGVQAARFIEANKAYLNDSFKRKALDLQQAFSLARATGPVTSEVPSHPLAEALGVRESLREREVDITQTARENEAIERKARVDAAEMYQAGKYEQAQAILKRASDRLGREIFMDPGNLRAAEEARSKTATQRLRERSAKKGVVIPVP